MSTPENELPNDRPSKHRPTGGYEVGYCKPPTAHRFRHGNKANPKGRGKGSRTRKVVIREVLLEPVSVREGGEVKQLPAIEAVLKMTLSKALAGDNKAALTIIGIAQKEGILTPEQEQVAEAVPETDLAIIEDAMKRLGSPVLDNMAIVTPKPHGDQP